MHIHEQKLKCMRQDEGYRKSKIGGVTKHLCWDGYDIACFILSPSDPNHNQHLTT